MRYGFDKMLITVLLGLILVILSIILFASNHPNQAIRYRLNDGKVVSCKSRQSWNCGVYLKDCDNGSIYTCLTNVEILK